MSDRFVVLGVAPARREWFRRVGHWANEAVLSIEFVKCISVDEVQSRLESGRPFSALLVDASSPGLDRDIIDLANSLGCSPVIIDHGLVERDWASVGVRAVLPEHFEADDLRGVLDTHAQAIQPSRVLDITDPLSEDATPLEEAKVITVTGAGGMGTSTVAMALAQGLALAGDDRNPIVLADMALRASQALLHDTRDVVPGLLEFVDSHRLGVPDPDETMATVHTFPERGYDLLLGLRNERDWLSISSRSLSASWTTLINRYTTVVCDVTGDFDGAEETGSDDIEDRNRLSRMAARNADIVVVVGLPGAWGLHHLVRTILALSTIGVPASKILPVINHAPRQPRARASMTSAIADLTGARISDADELIPPMFLGTRRGLETTLRDGAPIPKAMAESLASTIGSLLDVLAAKQTTELTAPEPVAVIPGSLGTWSEDDD